MSQAIASQDEVRYCSRQAQTGDAMKTKLTLIIETFSTTAETSGMRVIEYRKSTFTAVRRNAKRMIAEIESGSEIVDAARIENAKEETIWSLADGYL